MRRENTFRFEDGEEEFDRWQVSTGRVAELPCVVCERPLGEGNAYFSLGSRFGSTVSEESYARVCKACALAKHPENPPSKSVLDREEAAQIRIRQRQAEQVAQEDQMDLFDPDDGSTEVR